MACLEDCVEAAKIGELTLKGFHRPVAVFNVAARKAVDSAA
jgi:class 3 adenylate cyclase